MRRWICVGLLLATTTLAASDRYAWQWPLEPARADAGVQGVVLGADVYESVADPALGDLAVLDSRGLPVPAAIVVAPTHVPAGEAQRQALPWYPAPSSAPPGSPPRWRIRAESTAGDSVQRIETELLERGEPASVSDVLVDARDPGGSIQALELHWRETDSAIDARYRLDGSDDLDDWRPLREGRLLDLANDGHRIVQRRVDIGSGQAARYYRLRPLDAGAWPIVEAVDAVLAGEQGRVEPHWIELVGQIEDSTAGTLVEYRNPGRFPVAIADIRVAANSTGEWALESRDHADAPWRSRLSSSVHHHLVDGGEASLSPPRALAGISRDRYWRLRSPTPVSDAPTLRLGFHPETLVFLAQGEAPFTLVAGSALARRPPAPVAEVLASQRQRHGADWTPPSAMLGERVVRDGEAALRAPPADSTRDWTTWLLWGVLVIGAALVAGLALSLLRRAGKHPPP